MPSGVFYGAGSNRPPQSYTKLLFLQKKISTLYVHCINCMLCCILNRMMAALIFNVLV